MSTEAQRLELESPPPPSKPRIRFKDCIGIAFFGLGLYLIINGFLAAMGFDTVKFNGQYLHGFQAVLISLVVTLIITLVLSVVIFIGQAVYRFLF